MAKVEICIDCNRLADDCACSTSEELKALLDEVMDSLVFNKSLLPSLQKAHAQSISISFEPGPPGFPTMVRIRLEKRTSYIDGYADPDVLLSSIFYQAPATETG